MSRQARMKRGLTIELPTLKTQAAVGNLPAANRAVTSLFARKWTNSGLRRR
jgi:hypothetical protein